MKYHPGIEEKVERVDGEDLDDLAEEWDFCAP